MIENTVDPELIPALSAHLLALADDELLLGHRASEWCGHAPILEEDIAFANLALDEIGHAGLWYGLLAELENQDRDSYADQMVFFREPREFRCIQMVELPLGDWAFSMMRQYLFDAYELVNLGELSNSQYISLANVGQKIRKEEIYHHRHTQAWIKRLGLGTDESNQRLQKALEDLWPYLGQLFTPSAAHNLVRSGILPDSGALRSQWNHQVLPFLTSCGLTLPGEPHLELDRSQHTPHLKVILAEMQSVARMQPEAEW